MVLNVIAVKPVKQATSISNRALQDLCVRRLCVSTVCVLLAIGCLAASEADGISQARAQAMSAQRVALEASLKKVAPRKLVVDKLTPIHDNLGITGKPYLFLKNNLSMVINDGAMHPSDIKAIKATSDALKGEGIDLIVVPVPSSAMTYSYQLVDGIDVDHSLSPAFTRSLIELIDADVEVIDVRQAFRDGAQRESADRPAVMRLADHHWSSGGMDITAMHIANRIARYDLPAQNLSWQAEVKSGKISTTIIHFNKMVKEGYASSREEAARKIGLPETELITYFSGTGPGACTKAAGRRNRNPSPFVAVFGDSMVFHLGYNAGIAPHIGSKLDVPVTTHGKAGAARQSLNRIFKVLGKAKVKPRVIVLAALIEHFPKKGWAMPAAIKEGKQAPTVTALPDKVTVRLSEVAAVPDPDSVMYKDAILCARATVTSGPHKGTAIKVSHWAMRDRKLQQQVQKWVNGAVLTMDIKTWDKVQDKNPKIDSVQSFDEVSDLLLPQYWAVITE